LHYYLFVYIKGQTTLQVITLNTLGTNNNILHWIGITLKHLLISLNQILF